MRTMRVIHRLTIILFVAILVTAIAAPARAVTADLAMEVQAEASNNWFGRAVAAGFDFNGDGNDDLAVGAPFNSTPFLFAGRVYIYLRGPGADATVDITLSGLAVDDNLGWSIASPGDVNNDGYDDLVVGALDCCASKGLAYLYLGGAVPDNVADLTMLGAVNDDLFGHSVAGAGDVNGDGFDDWIVGAPQHDTGGTSTGRAYLYLGGSTPNNTIDLTLTGEATLDEFGYAVGGAGDVNGDGYDDVVVGAHGNDAGGLGAGRVYLFYGGSSLNAVADLVYSGATSDFIGRSVGSAGDLNGDGYDDWVVGSAASGGSSRGSVQVLFGGSIPNAFPDISIAGDTSDSLGFALSGGRDVDGDGYADLVVGVPGGGTNGEVQVFLGGANTDARADLVVTGEAAYDAFGIAVALAGDTNGDGAADLFVGAQYAGSGGGAYLYGLHGYRLTAPDGGEQWVAGRPATIRWLGRELTDIALSADAGASWTTLVEDAGGAVENSVTLTVPDVVTDRALVRIRIASLVISPTSVDESDATFRIVAPFDPPAAAVTPQATLLGTALGDLFGGTLAGAGDVNGDGFDDLIVGAAANDAAGTTAGQAYLYLGGPAFDATADVVITGALAGDQLGSVVDAAGDVNGDGFDDVLVSAISHDAPFSNGGAVFVYFGGSPMNNVADWTLPGTAVSELFGSAAAGAGDVNGDGYDDILVGAGSNDLAATNAGAAWLFFGGPAPDAVADWVVYGTATSDALGGALDGAGDVNRDGFADIVVGSAGNDAGGTNAGRAFIHHGGPGLDTVADRILTGAAASDNFGTSVCGVGDVDGDGSGDLLVGATLNDEAGVNFGSVSLYLGGPGADEAPDLTWYGIANENFGRGLGAAGDVNGDGFADFLIGASTHDQPATDAGRAILVHGAPGMSRRAASAWTGTTASWGLGSALAGVGDLNGDGFADILIGVPQTSSTGAGRALLYDGDRYDIEDPTGGVTWNVGALESIAWSGAEPADLWLSVNGGNDWALLESAVGGAPENLLTLRVPHQPTRFARLRLTPTDPAVSGAATSDSLFTIEASIALLNLKAEPIDGGGVQLSWSTDPGPADLAGYRIDRARGGAAFSTLVSLTRETSWNDRDGGPDARYRLLGINGLGQELLLGETSLGPVAALSAWPLPYRGGEMSISFLTAGGLGGRPGPVDVALFDVSGRRIRTVAQGDYEAGAGLARWDGRDDAGQPVPSGIYFLRAETGGVGTRVKIGVVR